MSVMSRPRQVDLSCFLQAILGCISAQCGRQEAWTTVDLALIRGLIPHDQGSSWGFLCLADVRRLWSIAKRLTRHFEAGGLNRRTPQRTSGLARLAGGVGGNRQVRGQSPS